MCEEKEDIRFITKALELAEEAKKIDEVPVGALIVKEGKIISVGHNLKEKEQNSIKHAEMEAISKACKELGTWRLTDCTLYVTLEPCLMCSGAIYQSRITRVVYGCSDPKGGALGTLYEIHNDKRLNHNFSVKSSILQDECSKILKDYFKEKRKKKS